MDCKKRIILLVCSDVILALLAFPVAYLIRFQAMPTWKDIEDFGLARMIFFVLLPVFMSFIIEIYEQHRTLSGREISARITLALGFSLIVVATSALVMPAIRYGQWLMTISLVVFSVLQLLVHAGYRTYVKFRGLARRVLILGIGPLAGNLGALIPTSDANYILTGYVKCTDELAIVPEDTILGTTDDLYEMAKREKADKIVVSLSERRGVFPLRDVMACKLEGIEVIDAPSFYEKLTGKLLLENITPSWFIFSQGFKVSALRRIIKRIMDLFCSTVGILLVLPLCPFIVLAIKLDSPGPILFRQERVGEREKTYTLYKFRTMRADAEKGTGAVWAQLNDPRITRVGEFFRKSRIDELPQLFNVLMGNMSLVGPRPERPEFVEKLKEVIPYYSERHFVKPGVTGWAQVRYPYGASVEDALEKLRYDLYYIKNVSPVFDLLIILETIKVVLSRRGR
jgi:sugar transferase (PEP-CTERM system associated)